MLCRAERLINLQSASFEGWSEAEKGVKHFRVAFPLHPGFEVRLTPAPTPSVSSKEEFFHP